MMKKLLSVLLVILVLFGASAAMADGEAFTPGVINGMEFSQDEWLENDLLRSLLTVLLGLEAASEDSSFDLASFLLNETYVVDNDGNIAIFYVSETEVYGMTYSPASGTAYMPEKIDIDDIPNFGATLATMDLVYYENTSNGIMTALGIVSDALDELDE